MCCSRDSVHRILPLAPTTMGPVANPVAVITSGTSGRTLFLLFVLLHSTITRRSRACGIFVSDLSQIIRYIVERPESRNFEYTITKLYIDQYNLAHFFVVSQQK